MSTITWGSPRADIDREIELLRATGITTIRADVSWKGTEPHGAGVLNTSWMAELDYAITRARAAGLDVVVPLVAAVPYWASSDPAKYTDATGRHWSPSWPPTSNGDYASWASRMAAHFAALGVTTFEIWNEPNHKAFWSPLPDAAAYAALLRPAAAAVRAAVPGARIVLGGLSGSDYVYLEALYAAGAAGSFDVMAVHPYTGSVGPDVCWRDSAGRWSKDSFCGLAEIRSVMAANNDAGKPVWLTEFGWSTTTGSYGVSEADQGRFIVDALDRAAAWPWIERAYIYQSRNAPWRKDDPSDWAANLGLVRSDFTPKPALTVVRDWLARNAAGTAAPETGTPAPDSGTPAPDSGTPAPDSGTTAPDAGTPAPVSGTPAPNTGTAAPESQPSPTKASRKKTARKKAARKKAARKKARARAAHAKHRKAARTRTAGAARARRR